MTTGGHPEPVPPPGPAPAPARVPLATVLREWGRIGCIGFGGPPTHIKLLRELCVERRKWLDAREFEDAIATCNLLPGPASTQLAIFCAWRLRGRPGALAGGAAFIVPGLIVILALSVLFLSGSPPLWVLGAGAAAGAAVPAVAVQAGWSLLVPSWRGRQHTVRWVAYLLAGAAAAATIGEWLALLLLGCGVIELAALRPRPGAGADQDGGPRGIVALPVLAGGVLTGGVLLSVAWVAFKVGALSYGGGFVIIPLMQSDAVGHYHWMTAAQFLNAVALGQVTPGPVVQTVAVVGYAAAGLAGGILAAVVAFLPSFSFVLLGAHRFGRLRGDRRARAFLGGAGPAAIGAILGSAIPLTRALTEPWQYAVLGAALILLLALHRGVVLTLVAAGALGTLIAISGGPLPH
jgi:chromate transporter